MLPYLFQYSDKDLMSKFKKMIQTNHMIQSKRPSADAHSIREQTRRLDFLSDLDKSAERGHDSSSIIFSDIKDFSSTNMSSIMQNQEGNIISNILRPFESGLTIFNNFQQMMLFKKGDDEFYSYKMKIYDVG